MFSIVINRKKKNKKQNTPASTTDGGLFWYVCDKAEDQGPLAHREEISKDESQMQL